MACVPSLAHTHTYRCAATRINARKGTHASCCISSSDCFGTPPNYRGNFSGLGTISFNVSFAYPTMTTTQEGTTTPCNIYDAKHGPVHLLVLVHGIFASPKDWIYAEAELKRRLGNNFLIYVSSSNTYIKTFAGIDEAGKRLADEVLSVVQKTQSLRKISFLAHSLGGLLARYAVAVLYSSDNMNANTCNNIISLSNENPDKLSHLFPSGKIAGLEPIYFITLATPHLGVRGRKQLPFLLGVTFLENVVAPIAAMFTGRTGRQLFLTDGEPKTPPLLLRMTSDYKDLQFLSSLAAFKNRILYANVSYDHMVGWRTSSIRRETELVKAGIFQQAANIVENQPPQQSLDGYNHIVNVQYCPPILSDCSHFPPEAAKAKEQAKNIPNTQNAAEYYATMEEEMIHGLQRVGWKKVDVSFHSALWPFFAHNNIHVKIEWLHNAGAGVIAHVADCLKQQESRPLIGASL